MRLKKATAVGCIALTILLMMSGCGKEKSGPYEGKWAYNHDTEKTALKIDPEGQAKLDGEKYSYTEDGNALVLQNEKGDKVRVVFKDGNDEIFVYKPITYVPEGTCDGLVGVWKSGRNSFEFSGNGTFREDGYFPGYYTVDTEKSEITLVYNDMFEDTVIPFKLTDKGLFIEYPWVMVRR